MSVQPYYHNEARRAWLIHEATSWLGTPFAENCEVKGPQGGVDCRHYLYAVHRECGALSADFWMPKLRVEVVRRWHEHHEHSLLLAGFARPELRERIRLLDEAEEPMIGDVIVLKIEQTEHHLALWCGDRAYHVAIPTGVIFHSTRDPQFSKLVRFRYRIMEPAAV